MDTHPWNWLMIDDFGKTCYLSSVVAHVIIKAILIVVTTIHVRGYDVVEA